MSDGTGIEWTDATWNVVIGCDKVSSGCDNCYAIRTAHRMQTNPNPKVQQPYAGTEAGGEWTGRVNLVYDRLVLPLQWRKPRKIFVNAQSDLFHDAVPDTFIGSVFDVMARAEHHTFQILTKRPARMRSLLRKWEQEAADCVARGELHPNYGHAAWRRHDMAWCTPRRWPLPNVWLGVSAEDQRWANLRVPALLDTPAAVRFISAEPLLGRINLLGDDENPGPAIVRTGWHNPGGPWGPDEYGHDDQVGIDWVIVGGESGPGARPMHPNWVRSLRDQCQQAGIAFLFKQRGEWTWNEPDEFRVPQKPYSDRVAVMHPAGMTAMRKGNDFNPFERGHPHWETRIERVGKHRAGRELDGRTWDQYPEAASHA